VSSILTALPFRIEGSTNRQATEKLKVDKSTTQSGENGIGGGNGKEKEGTDSHVERCLLKP